MSTSKALNDIVWSCFQVRHGIQACKLIFCLLLMWSSPRESLCSSLSYSSHCSIFVQPSLRLILREMELENFWTWWEENSFKNLLKESENEPLLDLSAFRRRRKLSSPSKCEVLFSRERERREIAKMGIRVWNVIYPPSLPPTPKIHYFQLLFPMSDIWLQTTKWHLSLSLFLSGPLFEQSYSI